MITLHISKKNRILYCNLKFPFSPRFYNSRRLEEPDNVRHSNSKFSVFKVGSDDWKERKSLRSKKIQEAYSEKAETNISLAKNFVNQRDKMAELLKDSSTMSELFKEKKNNWHNLAHEEDPRVSTYDSLSDTLGGLSYTNTELENSMMMICTYFINSVIVELNLRKVLTNEAKFDSFLFTRSLMSSVRSTNDWTETFQLLIKLYDIKEGTPKSLDDFVKGLDKIGVELLISDFKSSDHFNSLEMLRYFFCYFKTSQHLNYDESDTIKFVKSWYPIKFQSPEVNNSDYIKGFDNCFEKYKANNDLGHLELALDLSKVIITCSKYTPSVSIFKYLLDKLGEMGLLSYQTIVYDSIAPVKYKGSILGTPLTKALRPQRVAEHFQDLVESDPGLLESFIKFQVPRGDVTTLVKLLAFYRLNEVMDYVAVLDRSNLSKVISKSRFSRNLTMTFKTIIFKTDREIFVSRESIYSAIEACISLHAYKYIDALVDKLIVNSVKNDDEIQIALSLGGNPSIFLKGIDPPLIIAKVLPPDELSSIIFDKNLFKILLRASRESDDIGRLMWLTPHLDSYLNRSLEVSAPHIDAIKVHLRNCKDEVDERFTLAEDSSLIDMALISEIYDAMSVLGLDGKLVAYDKFLDFKNTHPKLIDSPPERNQNETNAYSSEAKDQFYFTANPASDKKLL
ncbi:uncharacterized protein PRCAT00005476001 [Priceomyces carsonii]|uniref:uncharacterized protein n=1 Tax=Priceomyces carsonii TaxID=28549 RepID=UPI002ED9DC5D|nr:unnamed protein product [Priceomyces carsonii]